MVQQSIIPDLYSDMNEMYLSRWTSRAPFSRLSECRISLSLEMRVPKEHAEIMNRKTQYTWDVKAKAWKRERC